MKLYEVNQAITDLLTQLDPDPETGEISASTEDIIEQIGALQMERERILEYLAKTVLDIRASAAALKEEEKRLKERRAALEHKDDRLMEILDRECAGQKTDCGVATVCYRKTSRVEVGDPKAAIRFLTDHGYSDCYKIPEPEVSKTGVKKLLQAGTDVPGTQLIQDLSCSLR